MQQCLSYVKRLQEAGQDVQLTEYAGAYHGFDNPQKQLTRVRLGAATGGAKPIHLRYRTV